MKKTFIAIFILILTALLCACGKDDEPKASIADPAQTQAPSIVEVKITLDNLFDYFEYKEYSAHFKGESGTTAYAQSSYGLALKEGYIAANSPEHKDTLELEITADGVVLAGNFNVDFSTLQYTGETTSSERTVIEQTLHFWPQGNRTTVFSYGTYSDSYIIYLENFAVTSAKGSIYLSVG